MRTTRAIVTTVALCLAAVLGSSTGAGADDARISTLHELFARLGKCWKSPQLPPDDPGIEITLLVSFKRNGEVLGTKITYASEYASDDEKKLYTIAVAETLQRCTPMPFTDELAGAVAGRPLRMRFDARRTKST